MLYKVAALAIDCSRCGAAQMGPRVETLSSPVIRLQVDNVLRTEKKKTHHERRRGGEGLGSIEDGDQHRSQSDVFQLSRSNGYSTRSGET